MISSVLLVLDEHCHETEMVTFAAELAGPLGASIVITHVTSSGAQPGVTRSQGADGSGASRVRAVVGQLAAVGLSAQAATETALHGDPLACIARVAAAEGTDLIIATSRDHPRLRGHLPTVAYQGALVPRDGPVAVVRTLDLDERIREDEDDSKPRRAGVLTTRTHDVVPRRARQEVSR